MGDGWWVVREMILFPHDEVRDRDVANQLAFFITHLHLPYMCLIAFVDDACRGSDGFAKVSSMDVVSIDVDAHADVLGT